MNDVIEILKRMNENDAAFTVLKMGKEIAQLRAELKYECERRRLAEKFYLDETEKNWFEKLFCS